ncbi:MAG: hypothetical protein OXB98_06665 [Bryobacterales bacterium]|nr:hypothetical protein [Bryobacterales bacterium]
MNKPEGGDFYIVEEFEITPASQLNRELPGICVRLRVARATMAPLDRSPGAIRGISPMAPEIGDVEEIPALVLQPSRAAALARALLKYAEEAQQ